MGATMRTEGRTVWASQLWLEIVEQEPSPSPPGTDDRDRPDPSRQTHTGVVDDIVPDHSGARDLY